MALPTLKSLVQICKVIIVPFLWYSLVVKGFTLFIGKFSECPNVPKSLIYLT